MPTLEDGQERGGDESVIWIGERAFDQDNIEVRSHALEKELHMPFLFSVPQVVVISSDFLFLSFLCILLPSVMNRK